MKRIILRVEADGSLQVSAPLRVPKAEIDAFVVSQKDWIAKIRAEQKKKKKNLSPFQSSYENGQELSVFGKKRRLQLQESQLSSFHLQDNDCYVFFRKEEKHNLDSKIEKYFYDILHSYLEETLENYSQRMELYPKYFVIKTMKSAWGIYHRRENYISFNSLLLTQAKEFISYVVIHELAHIRHLHHQKEFWNLVEEFCPSYREIKKLAQS